MKNKLSYRWEFSDDKGVLMGREEEEEEEEEEEVDGECLCPYGNIPRKQDPEIHSNILRCPLHIQTGHCVSGWRIWPFVPPTKHATVSLLLLTRECSLDETIAVAFPYSRL
jgi:hypothetical protein